MAFEPGEDEGIDGIAQPALVLHGRRSGANGGDESPMRGGSLGRPGRCRPEQEQQEQPTLRAEIHLQLVWVADEKKWAGI